MPVQNSTQTKPKLLNVDEAAAFLDVSIATVRRYFYRGHLPGKRIGPKLLRFAVADLEALIETEGVAK